MPDGTTVSSVAKSKQKIKLYLKKENGSEREEKLAQDPPFIPGQTATTVARTLQDTKQQV